MISLVSVDSRGLLDRDRTVGSSIDHASIGLLVVLFDALGSGFDGLVSGVPVRGADLSFSLNSASGARDINKNCSPRHTYQ